MTIKEAVELLPYGKCILFTGSGFSFGATNRRKKADGTFMKFRGANDIAMELAESCGFDEPNPKLGIAAQFYLDKFPKSQLADFLKNEFSVLDISQEHEIIGKIPWLRCYTTNYDEIYELASGRNGRNISPVTMSTPVKNPGGCKNVCVHINGAISRLTPDSLDNEFKLTNRSYRSDDLHYSPWFDMFKDDLLNADAVFFIGFSGEYDLDLTRVFQSTKELSDKTFFIVAPSERKSIIRNLQSFGTVYQIGLNGFVDVLNANPEVFDLKEDRRVPNVYKCFHTVAEFKSLPSQSTSDIADLLSKGIINDQLLHYSIREPLRFRYYIYRNKIDFLLNKIKDGKRFFLVVSSLGNGKTMFLEGAAVKLKRAGYQPFLFDKDRKFVIDEVEEICHTNKAPVFIFDGYIDNSHILRQILPHMSDNSIVILSERTARYETSFNTLDMFDEAPILIPLDKMEDMEIDSLITLFDTSGLWDDMASKSSDDKRKYIKERCRSRLSDFLLARLDASQLKTSIGDLLKVIKTKEEFYQNVLFLLFCHYFGIKLEFGQMMESMVENVMNNSSFRNNPFIKEMIDFDSEKVRLSSSVLALHILTRQITPDEFVDFYLKLFKDLDRKRGNRKIKQIMKEMMKHRNLAKILQSNRHIFSIYDNIAECVFCHNNDQFWLQYAIARLVSKDYENSSHYFETAYSIAKTKSGYSTYQIDTHYAHFLLSRAVDFDSKETSEPFKVFKEAHEKLRVRRSGDNYRYYIYRVAYDYRPFWDKFNKDFTVIERVEYKKACREILEMANQYMTIENADQKEIVRKTISALNEIVSS